MIGLKILALASALWTDASTTGIEPAYCITPDDEIAWICDPTALDSAFIWTCTHAAPEMDIAWYCKGTRPTGHDLIDGEPKSA